MIKKDIDEKTKKQISEFLPNAIAETLKSYEIFMAYPIGVEPKDFSLHHSSCKAALTHLELLLKLAKYAASGEDEQNDQHLKNQIELAEKRVKKYQETLTKT